MIMTLRGKSSAYAAVMIVVCASVTISACTWANPWRNPNATASEESTSEDGEKTAKKEMPKVKLTPGEQQIFDKYHSSPGMATGLSDQSRAVESRLGYK